MAAASYADLISSLIRSIRCSIERNEGLDTASTLCYHGDMGDLCTVCESRPRRENGTGGRSQFCTSCEWKRVKATPKRHAALKLLNVEASARYRKTEGWSKALRTDALKRKKGRAIGVFLTKEEWLNHSNDDRKLARLASEGVTMTICV